MPLHFTSPHCPDVIEVRSAPGTPVRGCVRIEDGAFHLFALAEGHLRFLASFASLAAAKAQAEVVWGQTP